MRVWNDGAGAMLAGLLGLSLAVSSCGLFVAAEGQEPPSRKTTPLRQQSADEKKTDSDARPTQPKKPAPTYTKDVAPILQSKCQSCHRRHQVGPFALETYEQARKRSHDIAAVTEERSMPPWKPTRGVGPKLKHDQSLTRERDRDPRRLGRGGRPAGDPKDLPPPPSSPRVGSSGRPT